MPTTTTSAADTDQIRHAANTAADNLNSLAKAWVEKIDAAVPRLRRELVEVHGVPDHDADTLIKAVRRDTERAHRRLNEGAVELYAVAQLMELVVEEANDARKKSGKGKPVTTVKTGA